MQNSTAAIISICKRNYEGPEWLMDCDTVDALLLYVSYYTGNGLYNTTLEDVRAFLREAVIDYISSDKTKEKRAFINNIYTCMDMKYDEVHTYISSFRKVRVRDKDKSYINGFNSDNTRKVDLLNGNV